MVKDEEAIIKELVTQVFQIKEDEVELRSIRHKFYDVSINLKTKRSITFAKKASDLFSEMFEPNDSVALHVYYKGKETYSRISIGGEVHENYDFDHSKSVS